MLVSFIPMILIASSYYYLNKADPDCGTTFSWVTRAIGPRTGWVTGWVMVAADIIVMASLAQITGTYFFLLIGANSLANSLFWVTVRGRRVPRDHVRDHGDRHRGLGAPAVVPAGLRVPHARDLLGRRADQGLHLAPGRLDPPGGLVVRAQHEPRGAGRRRAARPVHLLGLGHGGVGQRGDRAQVDRAGHRGDPEHAGAGVHLRARHHRGAGLPRARLPGQQLGRRAEPAGQRGARLRPRQAADRRRADLGDGVDSHDDPAGRPHHAVDGLAPGHPQRLVEGEPALPDARLGHRDLRRRSRSSGTWV